MPKQFPKIVYKFWPYVLRAYEIFFHHHRQNYLIGTLIPQKNKENLTIHLQNNGYEQALIALKDPGEILNMRKREGKEFQYHIRLYKDGEIRAHYEYAPEAHPITHCFNIRQESKINHFKELMKDYLK